MIYVQWLLIVIILILGVIGGYYHYQMIWRLKDSKRLSIWFGMGFFSPENLDEKGKEYRNKVIVCWVIGLAVAVIWVWLN